MELTFALLGLLLVLVVIFFAVSCAFLLKFFIKSAPKDVQERMKGRLDQPAWKTALGVVLILAVSAGVIAIFIYAGNDAMSRGWGFWQIFVRYLILFEGYKIFDMVVFDYILLTRLNIF